MTTEAKTIPTVSVTYARNGSSTRANAFGMRPMQERVYEKRGEQYLIIKSPPSSGKSRAFAKFWESLDRELRSNESRSDMPPTPSGWADRP